MADNLAGKLWLNDQDILTFARADGVIVETIPLQEAEKIAVESDSLSVVYNSKQYRFLIGSESVKPLFYDNQLNRQLLLAMLKGEAQSSEAARWLYMLRSRGYNPKNELYTRVILHTAKYLVPLIIIIMLIASLAH